MSSPTNLSSLSCHVYECPVCDQWFDEEFDCEEHLLNHEPTAINPNLDQTNQDTKAEDIVVSEVIQDKENNPSSQQSNPGSQKETETKVSVNPELDRSALVFLMLETGSLVPWEGDILEIGAACHNKEFQRYIQPTKTIDGKATLVNNLERKGNKLLYNGIEVQCSNLRHSLNFFIQWLKEVKETTGKQVVIVVHSASFVTDFLYFYLFQEGLVDLFSDVVTAFVDTLPALRDTYPGLKRYTLKDLVKRYFNRDLVKSAIPAARDLQDLFFETLAKEVAVDFVKFKIYPLTLKEKTAKIYSFKLMVDKSVISWLIASKLRDLGFDLISLQQVLDKSGDAGVKKVLQNRDHLGLPLTSSKNTIDDIIKYLKQQKQ